MVLQVRCRRTAPRRTRADRAARNRGTAASTLARSRSCATPTTPGRQCVRPTGGHIAATGVTSGGHVTSLLSAGCSCEIRTELTIPFMVQAARVALLQCHGFAHHAGSSRTIPFIVELRERAPPLRRPSGCFARALICRPRRYGLVEVWSAAHFAIVRLP